MPTSARSLTRAAAVVLLLQLLLSTGTVAAPTRASGGRPGRHGNLTCVATTCTVTCNQSAPLPCCLNAGSCLWDPIFVDFRCIPDPPLICGAAPPRGPLAALRSEADGPVAVPTPQQLAWQDMEVGAMIGFNLQTICAPRDGPVAVTTQRCQASSRTEGALFVPTQDEVRRWPLAGLDTDQWAKAAASFGAKYVVLVADHMTGFTLWDTKFHNYSVANTGYKGGGGDVVKDILASCKKFGLGLGFFYSVHFNWFLGVDGYVVGHPPLGPRTYTQAEYLAIAKGQLQEVIGMFGDEGPLEVWFDGGTGPSAGEVGPVVRAAAPNAVCHSCNHNFTQGGSVRWMGNEEASMPLPSWGAGATELGAGGDPHGTFFSPPSSDAVLREHYWFYQNNTLASTKTTKKLVQNWLTSVGRASNLILNVAPDGTGAVPQPDMARYAEMGAAVACLFNRSMARSSAPMRMNPSSGAMEPALEFAAAPAAATANVSVVIREDQTSGQLIGNYSLECRPAAGGDFAPCPPGSLAGAIPSCQPGSGSVCFYTGVGHKRIVVLGAATAGLSGIRVVVHSHFAVGAQVPALRDVELFDWSGPTEACV